MMNALRRRSGMRWTMVALTTGLLALAPAAMLLAGDEKECTDCAAGVKAPVASLDKLKALTGTWVGQGTGKMEGQKFTITFRPTSAGSAVLETMFPGTNHEMLNVYHGDGSTLMLTHYCAMGVQPRMRLASAEGNKLKFEFVDGINIKSRNDAHMDSLELTIDGDKLTESWSYFKDGETIENS